MGKSILFVIGIFSFTVHASESQIQPLGYFDIGTPQIREVEILEPTPLAQEGCEATLISPLDIGWDEIVNIGAKVWQIVVDNKPILHSTAPVAHALPRGMSCWLDLERWNAPVTRGYEVVYQNKLHMEVVKFRFRLQFTGGGRNKGRGRYLANATIMNSETNVSWGYTFNSYVEVPSAINVGTSADPVAGLELNLHWNVKTVIKESDNSVHFFVDGNGNVQMAN